MESLYTIAKQHFETEEIMKKLLSAHKALAELKWVSKILPNEEILINTLSVQEAKDSSEVENIITTHDELYQSNVDKKTFATIWAKEVYNYVDALMTTYHSVKKSQLIMNKDILKAQSLIEHNDAWFRKIAWTELKNERSWETVYIPPQNPKEILDLMSDFEKYLNDWDTWHDPLINVALLHYQFESIHPFYDWNGRVWRIINILYIVKEWLLDSPILYLSRYINQNKSEYYRYLQDIRDNNNWNDWILFILTAIEKTSKQTIDIINWIKNMMLSQKHIIREKLPKIYSQTLLNNTFKHPYTKIEFIMDDLWCSRPSAMKYLDQLIEIWILRKEKIGKENFYINVELFDFLRNIPNLEK